jgi:D-xylose transport system ATP-binding protein
MSASTLLDARNLCKRFGSRVALGDVTLELAAGELHAVCAGAGGGKTTLAKVLSGALGRDTFEGPYLLDGTATAFQSTGDAQREGVWLVGDAPLSEVSLSVQEYAGESLARISAAGLGIDAGLPVSSLSLGQRRVCELARALQNRPRVLVIDASASPVTDGEQSALESLLTEAKREGVACVYLTAQPAEAKRLGDRITILRRGRRVFTSAAAQVTAEAIAEHMARHLSSGEPSVLQVRNLRKQFGPVVALSDVTFDLAPGEVHALCGENGAGKSTLIKVLCGVYGRETFEGEYFVLPHASSPGEAPARELKPAAFATTADAEHAGVGVVHQELLLVPDMTVAENLVLGQAPVRNWLVDWPQVHSHAQSVLRASGIQLDATALISSLGVGQRQLCEIAKAIGKRTRILILDEPTAALAEHEIRTLVRLVKELRSRGVSCIYISHKLDEVFELADRITMIRDGRSILTARAEDLTQDDVIRNMVGRPISDLYPRRASTPGKALLSTKGLTVLDPDTGKPRLQNIHMEVRQGEVLGIGGLMGAGRSELLLHLFGAWGKRTGGQVVLDGKDLGPAPPHEIIRKGIALVSEDRKRLGLVLDQSITEQLTLSYLPFLTRSGLLDHLQIHKVCQELFKSLAIRAHSLETIVGTLSGGNQQKVVIGKALLTKPKVLFLDEPTRGIDVGAKQEVYELINRLTAEGQAVVLVSSELPELMGMSDRIAMLHDGHMSRVVPRAEATEELLLALAMGIDPTAAAAQ